MTPVLVLTTVSVAFDARALARALVERELVACVNIVGPIESIYRWNGAVEQDGELLLVMKTVEARLEELQQELLGRHPYEVPEFVVLPITHGSEPYLAWLAACTTRRSPQRSSEEPGSRS